MPLVILLHERWNKGCWCLKSQHINETNGFYYPCSWSFVLQSWVFEEIVKKFCLFWQKKIKCLTIPEFSPSFLVPQCSHEGSKKDLRGSTKLGCCGTRLKSRQWLNYGEVPSLWMGTWLMWITSRLGSYDATNKVSICPCQKVNFAIMYKIEHFLIIQSLRACISLRDLFTFQSHIIMTFKGLSTSPKSPIHHCIMYFDINGWFLLEIFQCTYHKGWFDTLLLFPKFQPHWRCNLVQASHLTVIQKYDGPSIDIPLLLSKQPSWVYTRGTI